MQLKVLIFGRYSIVCCCIGAISLFCFHSLLVDQRQDVDDNNLSNDYVISYDHVNSDSASNDLGLKLDRLLYITLPLIVVSVLEGFDWNGVKLTLISPDHLEERQLDKKFIIFGTFQDDKLDHILDSLTSDDVTMRIDIMLHQVIIRCSGDVTIVVNRIYKMKHYFYIEPIQLPTYSSPARAFYKFEIQCRSHFAKSRLNICQPKNLDTFLWHYNFSTFMPCNHALSKSFDFAHQKYSAGTKQKVTKIYFDGLLKLQNLFLNRKMPLMLWAGNMLGWYRHCDTVPHAHDVDFSVPVGYLDEKIILDIACKKGFYFKHVIGHKNESMTMTVLYRKLPIDIIVMYEDGNMSYTNTMDYSTRTRYRSIFPNVAGLCTTELRGYLFYVACNAQDLIRAEYGSTFMSLVERFDHIRKPKNLIQGKNYTEEEFEKYERRRTVAFLVQFDWYSITSLGPRCAKRKNGKNI